MATDATFLAGDPIAGRAPRRRVTLARPSLAVVTLYAALGVQFVSGAVFVGELWSEVLGLRSTPVPYVWQEYIQIAASLGLVVGIVTTIVFLRRAQSSVKSLRRQVDVAAGNFQTHLAELFRDWDLSPSERVVAIYAMKGFSNAEVARLRGTSASTVKSQLNAVYRKSGFANRAQLISFLVEELLSGVTAGEDADGAPT